MGLKVRKQIYIEPEQDELLKSLSDRLGVSEAQLIRQAIDAKVLSLKARVPRSLEAWKAERAFIQSLIDRGPVPGGRTWRREDLYDR